MLFGWNGDSPCSRYNLPARQTLPIGAFFASLASRVVPNAPKTSATSALAGELLEQC